MKDQRRATGAIPAAMLLSLAACFLAPEHAAADGALMSRWYADVWEPAQRGLLVIDPAAGREDLYLQAQYEGRSDDLAWIVPVPALPTLAESDAEIFVECARMTEPVVRDRGAGCADGGMSAKPGAPNDVDIFGRQQVGIYQTLTLGASSASVLTDSLDAWGYLHAANRAAVESALQFYIDKSWFFVAVRTDSAAVARQFEGERHSGQLPPIHLAFATQHPVFPMRISAISARESSHVLLYVCAPHRMTFRGARTEYANLISDRELRALRERYPHLGEIVAQPCFFTKLRRYVRVAEMDDDLALEQASDDHEFRDIWYSGIPLGEMMLAALAAACYARSRRFGRRRN